jgi:ABC-type nitrate/sulfonate/bicarbonate transport system substrate-binding protein
MGVVLMARVRILLLFALLCLLFTAGAGEAQKITFSYSSLIGTQSPLWIANDVGFFKKHRMDVNVVYIPGGKSVVEGMLAGNIQIAIAAPAAVLRANLGGSDFVYIGALSNSVDFVVITRDGIKSVQELRGKKIAIGNFGSGTDYAGRLVFDKLGMQVGKDIIFTQSLGGQPTRLAMLQSGTVDGVVLSPPFTLRAQQLGFRPVLDFSLVIPHYFSLGYFTRRSYIRDNPRVVENSVKGLLDATRYVWSNADGTIKILSRHLQISDEAFVKSYYHDVLLAQLDRDLYPDEKGVDLFLKQERAANPGAAKIKPGDFIDTSILDKLRKEGY